MGETRHLRPVASNASLGQTVATSQAERNLESVAVCRHQLSDFSGRLVGHFPPVLQCRQQGNAARRGRALAAFDGMLILDGSGIPPSGGAFLLDREAPVSERKVVDGDWTAEVREGGQYVLARGGTVANYEDARDQALWAAQRGLDLLCISGAADLSIVGVEDEHITWWREQNEAILRVTSVATISATVGAKVTVTDSLGNVRPDPPRPQAVWHESFRFFRLAQVTNDLFDAFRNLYLALESVLSSIAPPIAKGEWEGDWFRRALGEAQKLVDLSPFAPPGAADSLSSIYDDLYVNTRNAVFHAKSTRPHLLPHEWPERAAVVSSLRRLSRLYLKLVDAHLQLRRPSSGFYASGFKLMTQHLDKSLVIHVTDDETPVGPDTATINPGGGRVVSLATRAAPELDQPFVRYFIGQSLVSQLAELTHIGRIVTTGDDAVPLTAGILQGSLTLDFLDHFEAQMGLRLRNTQQPRVLYSQ